MNEARIRRPAVAGQFYPSSPLELKKQIESFIDTKANKIDCLAAMLPHAGYMYSGYVAAQTLSQVKIKDKIILLGPNHTGFGTLYSIMTQGTWQTPLGEIEVDSHLANEILNKSRYLEDDSLAHAYEHSLEVELPFLQYFKKDIKIVPIIFLSDDFEVLKKIGEEIAGVLLKQNLKGSAMILASSDMTHYEPQKQAENKDKEAIQAILDLDEDKLARIIRSLNITMCGYAPVTTMIKAAKILGAKKTSLIKYQTSGDVTGDKSSVVGYAGIIIS
jgi:hypothetical protein